MAEEKEGGHDPMKDLWFVVGALVILIVFWFYSGGPSRADLKGIFLSPPPPLGTGEAYGPQLGTTTASTTEEESDSGFTGSGTQSPQYTY